MYGNVISISEDTLFLKQAKSGKNFEIPLNSVNNVELNIGKRNYAARGALVGILFGALEVSDHYSNGQSDLHTLEIAVFGVLLHGLIGAGIGALIRADKWEKVPIEKISFGLNSMSNMGMGFSFSLPLK